MVYNKTQEEYPLVTICVPNYNYGRYLGDCLESLLNQTYPNIEISISDNRSMDDSYEIAHEYRKKFMDRGFSFHLGQNKRNYGAEINTKEVFEHTRGQFDYTIASDDMIAPDFIEKCMKVFIEYPNVSTVITHRREIDKDGNEIPSAPPFYNTSCVIDGESQAAVYMMAGIGIPGQRITKREYHPKAVDLKNIEHYFSYAGDWYVNFCSAMIGDVAFIAEPLCTYRIHSQSEDNQSQRSLFNIFEHFQMLNAFRDISEQFGMTKPAARYDEAVRKLGSMCLRYALKMLKLGDDIAAFRYLKFATFLKADIESEAMYKDLFRCLNMKGKEREELIELLGGSGNSVRAISYDPPDGFIPLSLW